MFTPRRLLALASILSLGSLAACGGGADGNSTTTGSGGTSSASSTGGTGGTGGSGAAAPEAADVLLRYLTGRFDSSADSMTNPQHFAIQLDTCRIDLPALGERLLYIEQAQLANTSQPYRQRVYVVEPGADPKKQARSRVFEFKTPASFINHCKDPAANPIALADIEEKPGCTVFLDYANDTFTGGTTGKECPSNLNGATYATSEVTLDAQTLASWDRGYDAADAQVWGATDGPYIFDRKTPLPEP